MHNLTELPLDCAKMEKEWVLTVQTPVVGLDILLNALRTNVNLRQGHYDSCLQLSAPGEQQFRALEGSHAGDEGTVQSVPVIDITLSIEPKEQILTHVIGVIYQYHVHEEPTIRVTECWATRSTYSDMKDNPNKYWNRKDAAEIHGTKIDGTT